MCRADACESQNFLIWVSPIGCLMGVFVVVAQVMMMCASVSISNNGMMFLPWAKGANLQARQANDK